MKFTSIFYKASAEYIRLKSANPNTFTTNTEYLSYIKYCISYFLVHLPLAAKTHRIASHQKACNR